MFEKDCKNGKLSLLVNVNGNRSGPGGEMNSIDQRIIVRIDNIQITMLIGCDIKSGPVRGHGKMTRTGKIRNLRDHCVIRYPDYTYLAVARADGIYILSIRRHHYIA